MNDVPESQFPEKNSEQNQGVTKALWRYESLLWTACNEVTQKLSIKGSTAAIGWAMQIEGRGWYGRVRDERGNWSFGPSTKSGAQHAVESWLRHEPIEPSEDEHAWSGDTRRILPPDSASFLQPSGLRASTLAADYERRHQNCDCHEGPIGERRLKPRASRIA
jgi:hypothetical protein